jgi:hypothetical protein
MVWTSSSVSLVTFKITFSPTGTLIFSPLGVALPFAIVMSMVSVLLLADGELVELDVGDVAGEEEPLGLPTAVGRPVAPGSALVVHPPSSRPKVRAPQTTHVASCRRLRPSGLTRPSVTIRDGDDSRHPLISPARSCWQPGSRRLEHGITTWGARKGSDSVRPCEPTKVDWRIERV